MLFRSDEIMKRADAAMYQAKKDGRNAIRFFESNVPLNSDNAFFPSH